jgi:hypothetical protein
MKRYIYDYYRTETLSPCHRNNCSFFNKKTTIAFFIKKVLLYHPNGTIFVAQSSL